MNEEISQLLRFADKDRWLSCLLAPAEKQAALMALYAFNFEIARIRETISEPGRGEIRLQFWADQIEAIYKDQSPSHPIAEGLLPIIKAASLPKPAFSNLIEARRFDLYDDPMPDLQTLEGYLGETSSILFVLAAQVLNNGAIAEIADAAGYAGVAYGLCGLLRSQPLHARRGQLYLPLDILSAHSVSPAEARSGKPSPKLDAAKAYLRAHADARLQEAKKAITALPKHLFPAFLPLALTGPMLKADARQSELSQLARQWHLWKANLLGRL